MSTLADVRLIPRQRLNDPRGWFLKVFKGDEEGLPNQMGEIYLAVADPGEVRGSHYHPSASEWFTVVLGSAQLRLLDPISGERQELALSAATPVTVYVPAGIGHAFINPTDATQPMMVIAYADRPYDPADTIPLELS